MLLRLTISVLRFFAGRSEKKELTQAGVRSILVVELSRLGDVVSLLPTLLALKSRFPTAAVHLLVDQRYHSLLNALDLDVHVNPVASPDSVVGMIRAIRISRKIRAELSISMSPAKRNAIAVLAGGSSLKIGYLSYANTLTPFLLRLSIESFGFTLPRSVSYERENIEIRAWKVIQALGVATSSDNGRIGLKHEKYETVLRVMEKEGRIPSRKYVVMHPFSGWEYRTWRLERFSELAERIARGGKHDVVFLYMHDDEERIEPVREKLKEREEVHFFPSRDVLESAVLMKGASLFLGNDSGPLHLASMLGVQVVGLFGPAEPSLTAPRAVEGSFFYERVECSPCNQRVCVRPDNPCMGLISVDAVYSAVMKNLPVASRASAAHA